MQQELTLEEAPSLTDEQRRDIEAEEFEAYMENERLDQGRVYV